MDERILIVGDAERTGSMRESLALEGLLITIAQDANAGYEQVRESKFDVVIVNLVDSSEGLSLIKRIRAQPELRRVSILTIGTWGSGQPTMALSAGADGFEPGPVDGERLIAAVRKLLQPNLTMSARVSGVDAEAE